MGPSDSKRTSSPQTGGKREAVRVRLLGGFRVSVGSRTIPQDAWRLRKAAALVKLLTLAPGHRMHREQAMDILWPDSGRKAASNNLRQVVYGVRKVLDLASGSRESYLSVTDERLFLCPEGQLWVDVEAFEDAAATARHSRDPAAYRAAIDLYSGELLPDDRYEEWAETRRVELRQLYLALLIELAGLYEGREEHALAIEALRKASSEDPTLEEAHASLMRLHALSGRPERALAQYERLRDALQRRIGIRPTEATRRLRDQIAAGRLPSSPLADPIRQETFDGAKHNLPAPKTSFVGREREMLDVKRALAMTRLLTLTGAGGSGKTRLSLEVAHDLVGSYPAGVWFVELAPLSESSLVPQEVAGALGVQERPGVALADTLADALRYKELLLVLDNCEHVAEGAAELVDALLAACPRLKVLATSREPLYVSGEVNWAVSPLSLPPESEGRSNGTSTTRGLMRYEAIKLFVERARQRLPSFELTPQNAGAVASVCGKLDGIPLAIELATARMGVLAVEQVAQRLDVSLDVLKGAGRGAVPRQQTMRATLDWSHDLLGEDEQRLLGRLSVFAGGWTLEAAESVCSGRDIEAEALLDLLGGLVDKSLVAAGAHEDGAVRYRMLEPIRQYAAQKLEEGGGAGGLRDRHAAFFLAMAEEAEPELSGPRQEVWMERLEREHDNMRTALSWVLERGVAEWALQLVAALWRFWQSHGYASEGVGWLERALSQGDPAASPARVKALEGMGWLTQLQGDYVRARANYETMLELSQEADDKANVATALNSLGTVAAQQGDNGRARTLLEENLRVIEELEREGNSATALKRFYACNLLGYLAIYEDGDYACGAAFWEESLALIREAGDPEQVGMMHSNLAYAALLQGDHERASRLCEEALSVARELGSVRLVPTANVNLGLAALGLENYELATESFREALLTSRNIGANVQTIEALEGMASLAGATGEATRAAHLWGAAEAAREADGIALSPGEQALHEPYLDSVRSRLGETTWEEALAKGRAMALEEAAEYAIVEETGQSLYAVPERATFAEPPVELTQREVEIAGLVGGGLTNRQISARLSISERTAANHVSKILRKLGLRSRTQIGKLTTGSRPPALPAD
jgi:predicted ATPase/DNA-binding SARP family transcriptional activator/DNA-binding CsgD family transcriptional regulator